MNHKSYVFVALAILILRPALSFADFKMVAEKFDNGVTSNEYYYQNGQLIEQRYFDSKGKLSGWLRFRYPQAGHVIKMSLSVQKEDYRRITSKEEYLGLDEKNKSTPNSVLLKRWVFADKAPYAAKYIEHRDRIKKSRILQKDYLDEQEKINASIYFAYTEGEENPTSFVEKDSQGKILSQYALSEKYDLVARLRELGHSEAEIAVLKRTRENPNKFLIGIIDSGFDYNHKDLVTKWWNNPTDPIDGVDNDGNGWIDDNFGWDQVKNKNLPSETTSAFTKDDRPLSHGTHVAHIATKNLDNVALIGFGGDYTQADYINKISAFLKAHKVRVVNMSLGLPLDFKDSMGLKAGINSYRKMIDENPETLFVVASGNAEQDIDINKNRQYPASFTQPNVLKVGALTAATIEEVTPENAKMAYFSNYGLKNVDILAPGTQVLAASLGGGLIAHSGTSMATPYMVNQVAQLWSEMPHLTAVEVRKLFIDTAIKLSPAAPILSGGYVNLKGALVKAKLDLLNGKQAQTTGPNCWNSATYIAGLSKGIHHTSDAEFRFLIDSPLCQTVDAAKMQTGDILALRRVNQTGKLLPASIISEVHAFNFNEGVNGFTKNGVTPQAGYQSQPISDVFNLYKSSEFKNCKLSGLDRKDCVLRQFAYRCVDIREYTNNKLNPFERDVLRQVEIFEKHIEDKLLYGQRLLIDKEKTVALLETQVDALKIQGSSKLFTDYLEYRLASLSLVF